MKHFVIGICLLAILLGGAIWSVVALDRTAASMEESLQSAWERCLQDDLEGAILDTEKAQMVWERNHSLGASLVDHERLEEIDRAFGDLLTYSRLADSQNYAQVCHDLMIQVRAMAEAEKPYLSNFL